MIAGGGAQATPLANQGTISTPQSDQALREVTSEVHGRQFSMTAGPDSRSQSRTGGGGGGGGHRRSRSAGRNSKALDV
eukprot:SAG22_NODE_8977_length_617_cov_0.978764_2_plen_78_part_00